MKLLFEDIDEPGLNTLPVYERRGGYRSLRRALESAPSGCSRSCWPPSCAGAAGRASDGHEGLVHAQGGDGQVPRVQRRRVRAGGVQRPRADAEEPAPADRGHDHRRLRRGREPLVHLHPRRIRLPGRHPRRRRGRGGGRRLPGRAHPGHRLSLSLVVHRGAAPTSAARRPRCSTRSRAGAEPAPQAPVPGQPGPLPGPDADQQRRDARRRPAHHPPRRRGVREDRGRELRGTKIVSVSGASSGRATTRSCWGSRRAS